MVDILNIGLTGLNASKSGLETTGHNLANANTDGYSRQKIHQTTNMPIGKSGLIHGTGTRVNGINRIHDQHIERRLNSTIANHEYFKERHMQLGQVEDIFNEINTDGLNKILNDFYNSFRDLANQPENETIRSVVRDKASLIAKDFRRIRETLDNIAHRIDKKIESDMVDINQTFRQIAKLNKKITILEAAGGETGDLRDQRDLAVRTLSEYFNVVTYSDNKGLYHVSAKGVGTLVSGGQVQEIMTGTKSKNESSNNMAGSIEIYYKNRPKFSMTDSFSGGRISSMIKARNSDIQKIQDEIDSIAFNLSHSVNAIHRRGFVNRQLAISEDGTPLEKDNKGITSGINFFTEPLTKDNAATHFDLSDAIKSDLSNIVTALNHNSPGDNRVAIAVSKLQHEKIYDDQTATLEEKYLQIIGNIGIETGKANLDTEQSEGILAQTRSVKERLSGVSIDEETANMMRYQQAYDASARVIKTADEMFQTVLGLKA